MHVLALLSFISDINQATSAIHNYLMNGWTPYMLISCKKLHWFAQKNNPCAQILEQKCWHDFHVVFKTSIYFDSKSTFFFGKGYVSFFCESPQYFTSQVTGWSIVGGKCGECGNGKIEWTHATKVKYHISAIFTWYFCKYLFHISIK